jgi:hypothetical protein
LGSENAGVWVLGAASKEQELLNALNALKLVDTPTSMLAASLTRIAPVTLALDEGWISNLFVSLAPHLLSPIAGLLHGFEGTTNVFVKDAEW